MLQPAILVRAARITGLAALAALVVGCAPAPNRAGPSHSGPFLSRLIRPCDPLLGFDQPAWSPDGQRILFSLFPPSSAPELDVINRDGSGQVTLVGPAVGAWSPAPSPDWTRIAFVSARGGSNDIYLVRGDGTVLAQMTHNLSVSWPEWSPDGKRLFFTTEDGLTLTVLDPDTGALSTLLSLPNQIEAPRVSPDGASIVFSLNVGGVIELDIVNADGSGRRKLARTDMPAGPAAWARDGSVIAFMAERGGADSIFTIKPGGTGMTQLTHTPGAAAFPAWSPDGTRLLFQASDTGGNTVHVIKADGTGQTALTTRSQNDYDRTMAWSPDGSMIAFISNQNGADELMVMNADGSGQTTLTHNPGSTKCLYWPF